MNFRGTGVKRYTSRNPHQKRKKNYLYGRQIKNPILNNYKHSVDYLLLMNILTKNLPRTEEAE